MHEYSISCISNLVRFNNRYCAFCASFYGLISQDNDLNFIRFKKRRGNTAI